MASAFALIDSYIYGFVLQEANLPFDSETELAETVDQMEIEAMAEHLPHLAELTVEHVLRPGDSFSDEFDFGLDLILDGLEQRLE